MKNVLNSILFVKLSSVGLLFVGLILVGTATQASLVLNNNKAKPYSRWKEEQIISAQNKVVRLSNLLLLLKSEKFDISQTIPEVAQESKQEIQIPESQQLELIAQAESDLSEAVAALEVVRDLTMKDYFTVYLQQFKNDPSAIQQLATEMDKTEIAEILMSLVRMQLQLGSNEEFASSPGVGSGVVKVDLKSEAHQRAPSKL